MKYKYAFLFIVFMLMYLVSFSQVGTNTTAIDPSAALDLTSTTQGFLPPRMDETQRDAITTPASGLVIYNTTANTLNFYNGTAWQTMDSYLDFTNDQTVASGVKTFNDTIYLVGNIKMPMGEISYFDMTGVNQVITNQYTTTADMAPVSVATALTTSSYEFDNGGANDGVLRYTGSTTKMFHIAVTISGEPETSGDIFVFGLAKNGTAQTGGLVIGEKDGTQTSAFHAMLMLSTNDELQFYVGNTDAAAGDFICNSLNIFAWGM